jgi:hypothetical protein
MVSIFMEEPKEFHWKATKRILRYPHGTIGYGLVYMYPKYFRMIGYTDLDWVGCIDDKKSTSGYSFSMISTIVSWSIKKKPTIPLSIEEA